MTNRIKIQVLRATSANRTSYTPAEGEWVLETDTGNLYMGDGTTAGGLLKFAPNGNVNSAANIGAGGVGVYKEIVGGEIRFKNINAGSSKVSVTADVANDEIDIDIVEGNINYNNLSNLPTLGTAADNDETDFATAAQGTLADSALQSGDNVSELTNDANYITSAQAPVQSVNGDTGTVVLDADDISDASTTNKFATQAQLDQITTNQNNITDLQNDKLDKVLSVNTQTGNYTIQASDSGAKVLMNNSSTATVTLPNGLDTGFQVAVSRIGSGIVTVSASGTLNSQGTQLDLQHTGFVATHLGSNVWLVEGRLV
jgi:hypothetical protein